MSSEVESNGPSAQLSCSRAERVAKIGTVISAIMASSCCWAPLLLVLLGFAGISTAGMAQTLKVSLETYRPVFMVVTFGFLGFAFYFTYRPRRVAVAGAGNSSPAPDC